MSDPNYRLKTTDKGRSLTCNDKPVVEWHLENNQHKGTSNHGIKTSDLRALADWDREIKEQKRLRLKAQQQKMLDAQQKTKANANANATKILQLLRSWKQKKPRTTLPEGYRAIDGEEKGERILLKGDREILRLKKSGLITGDARDEDVQILQKWHEQHIGHTARRKPNKRLNPRKRLKPKQKKGLEH